MKFSSHIKPISYLKSHTAEIVRELSESREPLLITQNGEAKLVVMDVKSYEEGRNACAVEDSGAREPRHRARQIP